MRETGDAWCGEEGAARINVGAWCSCAERAAEPHVSFLMCTQRRGLSAMDFCRGAISAPLLDHCTRAHDAQAVGGKQEARRARSMVVHSVMT
eukprot:6185797-Pleurochrysis_carterae.AAC.2